MSAPEPSTMARPRGADPGEPSEPSEPVVPALTILWHHDPGRVGEVAPLGYGAVAVSRRTPPFELARDVTISRAPFLHLKITRDALELHPGPGSTVVSIEGQPLGATLPLPTERLRDGLVLTFGDDLAVCLHLARFPRLRGPAQGLVGGSDAMEMIRRQIAHVAESPLTVLIRGETGTGKEVVAHAIRASSLRASGPFVCVNMAAITASTAVAELFGHERGAFTGATEGRAGYFGEADGGTLFLDEIGAAPLEIQRMLLRVLETGEIRPLGAKRARRIDVRVLAATDEELEAAVRTGRFAEPLLHRLSAYQIQLPPLRARREDVGPLLLHFLRQELLAVGEADRLHTRPPPERPWLSATIVADVARGRLAGNARGLRNLARQLVVSNRGRLVADVPVALARDAAEGPVAREPVPFPIVRPARITDSQIHEALRRHHYNVSAAAEALGIHRTTLHDRIRENPGDTRKAYEISDEELRAAHQRHGGDIVAMAAALRVSPKPLKARLRGIRQQD